MIQHTRPANDDFSPMCLTKIGDFIYLNLFDEVAAGSMNSSVDIENDHPTTSRLERRWLGSLRIPFATLYLNSKIEGTFSLNSPPALMGYDSTNSSTNGGTLSNTYLTLFLTIDPTLQHPEPMLLKVSLTCRNRNHNTICGKPSV